MECLLKVVNINFINNKKKEENLNFIHLLIEIENFMILLLWGETFLLKAYISVKCVFRSVRKQNLSFNV